MVQRLEVYKRERSSDDATGGSWAVGWLFRFGALGQLDALACMTGYAQARPTLSTTSATPLPYSAKVAAPKWERQEGWKQPVWQCGACEGG